MNEDQVKKVKQECAQNYSIAKRRYNFLKTMPKALRPIEWQESIEAWEEGIKQYEKEETTTRLDK